MLAHGHGLFDAGNKQNPRRPSISQLHPEVDKLLEQFIQQVSVLIGLNARPVQEQQEFKTALEDTISSKYEAISHEQKLQDIHQRIIKGEFDAFISASMPQASEKLDYLVEHDNYAFMQRLLLKVESKSVFEYWINKGVKLYDKVLASAIHLRSHKAVFEYLKENGHFSNISGYERDQLLIRANLLKQIRKDSYDYIVTYLPPSSTLSLTP